MASAHPSWFDFLAVEAHKPYFSELRARVVAERERFEVYPLILTTGHPSPLSTGGAFAPFRGSRPFSRANAFLRAHGAPGVSDVDWRL